MATAVAAEDLDSPSGCRKPTSVEWRIDAIAAVQAAVAEGRAPTSAGGKGISQRAAVCLAGVARFIDKTEKLMRHNLLKRIGMPHDLYTFASAGRKDRTCEEFRSKEPLRPLGGKLRRIFHGPGMNTTALAREWASIAGWLDASVASRVVTDDRPPDLLQVSNTWRRAALRPGAWLGGIAHGKAARSGAGLAQWRGLQWCADAIRWHEANVLGHEYAYILFSRWDLNWLIPFPGLSLLQEIDKEAVWVTTTHGEFFHNDRSAVVPRKFLSGYFEAWKLVASGKVHDLFETTMPGSGFPVYWAEDTNCEAFLWARMVYAGARVAGLPAMAYVHCTPSDDVRNLRTKGFTSCSSFTSVLDGFPGILGGTKYAREFSYITLTDNVLNGEHNSESSLARPTTEGDGAYWRQKFHRLFSDQDALQPEWTIDTLLSAALLSQEIELDRQMDELDCQTSSQIRHRLYRCRNALRIVMALATLRSEHYRDALTLARARVIAAPLHLEGWLWLTVILLHPYLEKGNFACAAVEEARKLNPTHGLVLSLGHTLGGHDPSARLDDALGGANATRRLRDSQRNAWHLLQKRRRLQRACKEGAPSTREGLEAWLALGRQFLREHWLLALASVVLHLKSEYLADGRPEALRERAPAVAKVRDLESKFRRAIEKPVMGWGIEGASPEDFLQHAPSSKDLLDLAWLEAQEARTGFGGRDVEAKLVRNVAFSYSRAWGKMVATGLLLGPPGRPDLHM